MATLPTDYSDVYDLPGTPKTYIELMAWTHRKREEGVLLLADVDNAYRELGISSMQLLRTHPRYEGTTTTYVVSMYILLAAQAGA